MGHGISDTRNGTGRSARQASHGPVATLTGDDGELAPEICQAHLGDIQAVDEDAPLYRLHEAEERERERAFARSRPPKDADFLTRAHLEGEVVQHVGQFGLCDRVRVSGSVSRRATLGQG